MKVKMKVNTDEGRNIIESFSCLINKDNKAFFYIPMWFEEVDDGEYIMHEFGKLPKELKEMIRGARSEFRGHKWEAIEAPIKPEDAYKIDIKKK